MMTLADFWNSETAHRALALLLDLTIKGTLVLALAAVVALALRRASSASRHLLWTAAMAAVIVSPLLGSMVPKRSFSLRIKPARSATFATQSSPQPTEPSAASVTPSMANQPLPQRPQTAPSVPLAAPSRISPEAIPAGARKAHFDVQACLVLLWLFPAAFLLASIVAGHLLARAIVRRAQETGDSIRSLVGRAPGDLSTRRVRIVIGDSRLMPMTCGIMQPVIILPDVFESWPEARRRAVLSHELAHVRRRDCLAHLVGRLAFALQWFNPLAWVALRRMRIERERACDDLVLAGGSRASDYADHVLDLARTLHSGLLVSAAGVTMARPSSLESRLLAILDPARRRNAPTRRSVVGALIVVTICVAILPSVRFSTQAASPEPKPPEREPVKTLFVARWKAVLNGDIAQSSSHFMGDLGKQIGDLDDDAIVKKMETAWIQARIPTDWLFYTIRQCRQNNGILYLDQHVNWLEQHTGRMADSWAADRTNYPGSGNQPIRIGGSGFYSYEVQDGIARLDLDYAAYASDDEPSSPARIEFKGELRPGWSLVFMSFVKTRKGFDKDAVALVVWQELFSDNITDTWDLMQHDSRDPAEAWKDKVSARWTRTSPAGDVVQLLALTRPGVDRNLWWTPDGRRIKPRWKWLDGLGQRQLSPQYRGLVVRFGLWTKQPFAGWGDPFHFLAEDASSVTIGIGYGPWESVGMIDRENGQIVYEGKTFKIPEPSVSYTYEGKTSKNLKPYALSADFDHPWFPDTEFTLAALHGPGFQLVYSEACGRYECENRPKGQPTRTLVRFPKDMPDNAAIYLVKRPRVWFTFEGFATKPK